MTTITPKCLYVEKCGNDADWKTLNGKKDGRRSELYGKLGYGNNHRYNWNLCGKCFAEESGDTDTSSDEDTLCGTMDCDKCDTWGEGTPKCIDKETLIDMLYNARTANGEAVCEDCGKWGMAVDMDYDDDTGFHTCCKQEPTDEDEVCCVACNDFVCYMNEEPPHKDNRDEAVCRACYLSLLVIGEDGVVISDKKVE